MDPNAFLPLSPRDFLTLLVLAERPLHGYGILKAIEARVGDEVSLDPANLYRSLKRLRRDGIVEVAEEPDDVDAPIEQRRYFALTETGRDVVAAEAQRLAKLTTLAREIDLLGGEAAAG